MISYGRELSFTIDRRLKTLNVAAAAAAAATVRRSIRAMAVRKHRRAVESPRTKPDRETR